MLATLAALVGSVAAVGAHGAYHRNSPVFGRATGRLRTSERAVALTFDDGPNPVATPAILDALVTEDVRATFFLLGKHVDAWPHLARRIVDEGHAIGTHGYHHAKLHTKGPGYVRLDLNLGVRSIAAATGVSPRLFRAPHGFRSPWVNSVAASMSLDTIGWSVGVWDTELPGAQVIAARAVAACRPGTILLLHDGDGYDPLGDRSQTAEAVPEIIRSLRRAGYRFVTLPG